MLRRAQPCVSSKFTRPRGHRFARHHLQLGIERGPHRETAFVEFFSPYRSNTSRRTYLGKILAGEMCAAWVRLVTASASLRALSASACLIQPFSSSRSTT